MMDSDSGSSGQICNTFVEYQVPFCRPVKCVSVRDAESGMNSLRGTDGQLVRNNLWNCLPVECQGYLTGLVAVIVMIATMTVTFNCLVLGINLASKTRRMRRRNPTISNFSTYVVSLAVADLLVGVVVLPLCVVNFYFEFMLNSIGDVVGMKMDNPQETNAEDNVVDRTEGAMEIMLQYNEVTYPPRMHTEETLITSTGNIEALGVRIMSPSLISNLLGFFTHLTLFVSVYTLISASADRFYSATHSVCLKTSKNSKSAPERKSHCSVGKFLPSFRRSSIAVTVVWILGIAFALIPLIVHQHFHFRHVGHVFAAMTSDSSYEIGVHWYLFTLVVSLIGMWALNILICFTLWRRKRQLQIRRKRSLNRQNFLETSANQDEKPEKQAVDSGTDSVYEHGVTETSRESVLLYPPSCWKQSDSKINIVEATKYDKVARRKQGRRMHKKSDSVSNRSSSQMSHPDYRSSGLRRKLSSLRRAKEILHNQSYETNITKTLCIVVVAFTIAVLPLIVVVGNITRERGDSLTKLNAEVTALTCSLLLLFSNSFVNCVIYGARMRDFRTAHMQIFRKFFSRIKKTLCCSYGGTGFSKEFPNSVYQLGRLHRTGTPNHSPRITRNNSTANCRYSLRSPTSSPTSARDSFINKRGSSNTLSPLVGKSRSRISTGASQRVIFYPNDTNILNGAIQKEGVELRLEIPAEGLDMCNMIYYQQKRPMSDVMTDSSGCSSWRCSEEVKDKGELQSGTLSHSQGTEETIRQPKEFSELDNPLSTATTESKTHQQQNTEATPDGKCHSITHSKF